MGFWDIKYNTLGLPYIGNAPAEGVDITKKTIIGGQIVGVGAVKSLWSGLGTTGKVGVGIIGGAGGYATYDWLFGGTKKQAAVTGGNDNSFRPAITNTKTYSPVITTTNTTTNNVNNQYDFSDNRIVVNGNNNQIETKKAMSATATATVTPKIDVTPKWNISPSSDSSGGGGGDAAAGMDWATIAAIAGVALVAYGYTSRKGSK